MTKSQVKTSKKQDLTPVRNEKGQIVSGTANPNGRPPGTKNFSTLMDDVVKDLAKANKITEGEVWQILIKKGYSEASKGKFQFYKDILDRYFGPTEKGNIVPIQINFGDKDLQ